MGVAGRVGVQLALWAQWAWRAPRALWAVGRSAVGAVGAMGAVGSGRCICCVLQALSPRAKFPQRKIGFLYLLFDFHDFGSKSLFHMPEDAEFGSGIEFPNEIA